MSRSHSTGALRKLSTISGGVGSAYASLEQELQEQEFLWQRTHSLSNTQKVLDDAIKDLEEYISEDLASLGHHCHYSSNDSAMGGSELVISPVQPDSVYSEPATLDRKRQVFHSTDSAFSNNSSPTNSSDGPDLPKHAHSHSHSEVLSSNYPHSHHHIRMLSEASTASTGSPAPPAVRPTTSPAPAPAIAREAGLGGSRAKERKQCSSITSLPGLTIGSVQSLNSSTKSLTSSNKSLGTLQQQHTSPSTKHPSLAKPTSSKNKKRMSNPAVVPMLGGTYSLQRSPILSSRDYLATAYSESKLDSLSSDHTPTESAVQIISSPSGLSLDSHEHRSVNKGTVI